MTIDLKKIAPHIKHYPRKKQDILSLLDATGVSCFYKQGSPPYLIVLRDPLVQVLCLPPSTFFPAAQIEEFAEFLKQADHPLVLYWPRDSDSDETFTPTKIVLEKTAEHEIQLSLILFKSTATQSESYLGEYFAQKLKERMMGYTITVTPIIFTSANELVPSNNTVESAALTLLYELMEEVQGVQKKGIEGLTRYQKQFILQDTTLVLLEVVAALDEKLFYSERGLSILEMPMLQRFYPSKIRDIRFAPQGASLKTLMRVSTFLWMLLQQDIRLMYFPVFYGIHYGKQKLLSTLDFPLSKLLVNYLFQMLVAVLSLSFAWYWNFSEKYSPEIVNDIVRPRFVVSFFENLFAQVIKTFIELIAIFFTCGIYLYFSPKNNHPKNDEGVFAFANLLSHFFIYQIEDFLRLDSWSMSQYLEQTALLQISAACRENCTATLETSTLSRSFRQAFGFTQYVRLTAVHPPKTTHCELSISKTDAPLCFDYQLSCQSFLDQPPDTTALANRDIINFRTVQCAKKSV